MKYIVTLFILITIVGLTSVHPAYALYDNHPFPSNCDYCHDCNSATRASTITPIVIDDPDYIHGNFAANSAGCAVCHITHAAESPSLLNSSYDTTRFCFACHGFGTITSQYDVFSGMIRGNDGRWRPSAAGGFYKSANPYSDWTDATKATFAYNTSGHNVVSNQMQDVSWIYFNSGQVNGDIPGGSRTWSGELKCTNCHDPHAGGKYPAKEGAAYNNPRLLRKHLLSSATETKVYMKIDYDYAFDPASDLHTYQTLEYGKGFNQWCGQCHDLFNTEGSEQSGTTGIDNGMSELKYRHKVGVSLTSTDHPGFSTSIKDGVPLATTTTGERDAPSASTGYMSCLSCHRAHGSAVDAVGYSRFKPYESVTKYENAFNPPGDGGQELRDSISVQDGASALLRLPNRDACFKCHGAAQFNKPQSTANYGTGY